jgi:hypothetical protein
METILRSWFGAYTGDLQREVEEYFKTPLLGVAQEYPNENAKGSGACETWEWGQTWEWGKPNMTLRLTIHNENKLTMS